MVAALVPSVMLWNRVLMVVTAAPRVMLAGLPVPSMMRTLVVAASAMTCGPEVEARHIGVSR